MWLRKDVGTDPGAGTAQQRQLLQAALKAKPRDGGLDYHVSAQQAAAMRPAYLARWANALRLPVRPRAERTARAIASHLLDIGYSSDFLHRWWKYRLLHEAGTRGIADLVDDAQQLAQRPPRDFDVVVPLASAIRWKAGPAPSEWRTPRQVSQWLRSN